MPGDLAGRCRGAFLGLAAGGAWGPPLDFAHESVRELPAAITHAQLNANGTAVAAAWLLGSVLDEGGLQAARSAG